MRTVIIGLTILSLVSCKNTNDSTSLQTVDNISGSTDRQDPTHIVDLPDYSRTLTAFQTDVKKRINELNEKGNSITNTIELDTLFVFQLENGGLLSLGQYHTVDKKLTLGIVGVDLNKEIIPTFLLTSDRSESYIADSVGVIGDNIFVYGKTKRATGEKSFKIGFDSKFDGSSFPWNYE